MKRDWHMRGNFFAIGWSKVGHTLRARFKTGGRRRNSSGPEISCTKMLRAGFKCGNKTKLSAALR